MHNAKPNRMAMSRGSGRKANQSLDDSGEVDEEEEGLGKYLYIIEADVHIDPKVEEEEEQERRRRRDKKK